LALKKTFSRILEITVEFTTNLRSSIPTKNVGADPDEYLGEKSRAMWSRPFFFFFVFSGGRSFLHVSRAWKHTFSSPNAVVGRFILGVAGPLLALLALGLPHCASPPFPLVLGRRPPVVDGGRFALVCFLFSFFFFLSSFLFSSDPISKPINAKGGSYVSSLPPYGGR